MGQCMGKPSSEKIQDSYSLQERKSRDQHNKNSSSGVKANSNVKDEDIETKRKRALEAAEKRKKENTFKGAKSSKKYSKKIEAQGNIGPGRSGVNNNQSNGISAADWN